MNTEEKLFRDRLEKSLGKYCPNITALNQISTYLFREVVDVIRQSGNVNEILQSTEINSDMENLSFIRAIKDLSTFSSQVIINEAFKKAFQDVRNTIPLTERSEVIEKSKVIEKSRRVSTPVTQSTLSRNEAEFDIDISSIPKVNPQLIQQVVKTQVQKDASNVFEGDFEIDLDDVNQRTVKSVVSNKGEESEDKDFTTDGSTFSEEVYSDSFTVDMSLDY